VCVIYACATEVPSEEELRRGALRNGHGAGIGWVDKEAKTVRWIKGLTNGTEVLACIKDNKIPLPMAIHFRTASVGGENPHLTHPFPLTDSCELDLTGECSNGVLFHNGHVGSWEDLLLRVVLATTDYMMPGGTWSDTRALAVLTNLKGTGILKFVCGTSRVAVLTPDGEEDNPWSYFYLYGNWDDAPDDQGWMQSCPTIWTARGGRCYIADDDEDAGDVKVLGPGDATTPTTTASPRIATAIQAATNIWTVEELNTLLTELEKELADARSSAGL